jgi:hypothetical protein
MMALTFIKGTHVAILHTTNGSMLRAEIRVINFQINDND